MTAQPPSPSPKSHGDLGLVCDPSPHQHGGWYMPPFPHGVLPHLQLAAAQYQRDPDLFAHLKASPVSPALGSLESFRGGGHHGLFCSVACEENSICASLPTPSVASVITQPRLIDSHFN